MEITLATDILLPILLGSEKNIKKPKSDVLWLGEVVEISKNETHWSEMLLRQMLLVITTCYVNRILARPMQTPSFNPAAKHQMPTHTKSKWRHTVARRDKHDLIEATKTTPGISLPDKLEQLTINGLREDPENIKHHGKRATQNETSTLLQNTRKNELPSLVYNRNLRSKLLQQRRNISGNGPVNSQSAYTIYADVGVGFQKYLSTDIFGNKLNGTSGHLNVQLHTADNKGLFKTSWIQFDQSRLKVYGFPLQGNQNKHEFLLKATRDEGAPMSKRFIVIVSHLRMVFNHYIEICTSVTLAEYAGDVERRIQLSKSIGTYFFKEIRLDDVWITRFNGGCITVVFRQLPAKQKCDFKAINMIREKLFENEQINAKFRQALKNIAWIKSANITLLNECKNKNVANKPDEMGWLRDVAPVFILLAVVAVPTLISCIVCKEVRRRQALMRQIQDRRMKEDKEQMLIQAAEYKHECGLDSESEEDEEYRPRPSKNQSDEEYKFFGFSKIADIIIPDVVKQGTELLNTLLPQDSLDANTNKALEAAQKKVSVMASLNPRRKLLDLSQEEKHRQEEIELKGKNSNTRVKKMVRFMKNPLEIKPLSIDESIARAEENRKKKVDNQSAEENRKRRVDNQSAVVISPRPSISVMLSNIPSIISKLKSEHAEMISSSLRNKLEFLLRSTSSFSPATTIQASPGTSSQATFNRTLQEAQKKSNENVIGSNIESTELEHINAASKAYKFLPSKQMYLSSACSEVFDLEPAALPGFAEDVEGESVSPNLTFCLGEVGQTGISSPLESRIDNERLYSQDEMGELFPEDELEELYNESTSSTSWEQANLKHLQFQLDYNLKQHAADEGIHKASLQEYKQHSEIEEISNFEEPDGAENTLQQMGGISYGISTNLEKEYLYTTQMVARKENEEERFSSRSDASREFTDRPVFVENRDFYFVNKPDQHLTRENLNRHFSEQHRHQRQFYISEADSQANIDEGFDAEIFSGSEDIPCKDTDKEDNSLNATSAFTAASVGLKGLQHYNPITGEWYSSKSSQEDPLTDEEDMLHNQYTDQNHPNEMYNKGREHVSNSKSKLVWHDLDIDPMQYDDDHFPISKPKRKTGLGLRVDRKPYNDFIPSFSRQEERGEQIIHKQRDASDLFDIRHTNDYDGLSHDCGVDYGNEKLMERKSPFVEREPECCHYFIEQEKEEIQTGDDDETDHFQEYEKMQSFPEDNMNQNRLSSYTNFQHQENDYFGWQHQVPYHQQIFPQDISHSFTLDSNGNMESEDNITQTEYHERKLSNCCLQEPQSEIRYEKNGVNLEEREVIRRNSQATLPPSISCATFEDSSSQSEVESTEKSSISSSSSRTERRKSFLERQDRVEVPEHSDKNSHVKSQLAMQLNPMFVIEEDQHPEMSDDRGNPDGDTDALAVNQPKPLISEELRADYNRKPPYGNSFSDNEVEVNAREDEGVLDQQMRSCLQIDHPEQHGNEPLPIFANRGRVDPVTLKRPGMRRFSMESWTSTPEKYYYDATGDGCISEEDITKEAMRSEKQNQSFIGRGRAREYTTRLLKGVSPKIRRHSTSVMGPNIAVSSNSGTFLGKIGEGKFVQTIQTKLGRKESRSEDVKSLKMKELEKSEEDKCKGSPLNAIRNKLYLLSGK
eukprot:gene6799-7566_t